MKQLFSENVKVKEKAIGIITRSSGEVRNVETLLNHILLEYKDNSEVNGIIFSLKEDNSGMLRKKKRAGRPNATCQNVKVKEKAIGIITRSSGEVRNVETLLNHILLEYKDNSEVNGIICSLKEDNSGMLRKKKRAGRPNATCQNVKVKEKAIGIITRSSGEVRNVETLLNHILLEYKDNSEVNGIIFSLKEDNSGMLRKKKRAGRPNATCRLAELRVQYGENLNK
uniref:DHHA2 domain-containing protein n=1 Tax=Rhabditophanes sp. KR3021 TaxID=114890 RepID=A0AC35U9L9_9BILA